MNRKDLIEYKTGVEVDTKCQSCGITAEESYALGPVHTGINHPEYCKTYSFYSWGGESKHTCPRCHKEESLKKCFDAMG